MDGDDGELIARIRTGNEAADKLFGKYRAIILQWAQKSLPPEHAEDLTQKVCIEVLKSLGTYQEDRDFKVLIWGIYRNVRNQYLRDQIYAQRETQSDTEGLVDGPAVRRTDPPPPNWELRQAIYKITAQLPESYRLAFVYRELQELSYEEISQALGIPLGTVRSRISEARKIFVEIANKNPALRKYLEGKAR